MTSLTARQVFRAYETDGVPSSGAHKPQKSEIVELLNSYQHGALYFLEPTGATLTSELQAALDDYGGVYLPEGNYTCGQVTFPDDAHLVLHPNAVITPTTGFAADLWVLGNWCSVEGGQFSAPKASFPLANMIRANTKDRVRVRRVRMTDAAYGGIVLVSCTNALIEGNTVANTVGPAIYLPGAGSAGNVVRDNQSLNSGSHGIQLSDGVGNLVEGNYVHGAFAFGISIAGGEVGTKVIGNTTQKTRAEGINFDNTFGCVMEGNSTLWSASGGYASTDFGICLNGDTSACDRNIVANNYVDGCAKSGIAVAGTTSGKYNAITGNTITNVNSLNEAQGGGVLLYGANATGNIVGNNVCRGDGINMKYGVNTTVSNTSGNIVGANSITNVATAPMLLTPLDAFTPAVLESVLLSDFTGSNGSSAQPIFSSAQDTLTLAADTTYEFEAEYFISRAAGTTSHTTAVLFGGTATFDAIRYLAEVINPTGNALANVQAIRGDAATALTLTAANTSATETLAIKLKGRIRTNAAGTLIPQFQYSSAPGGAPTILANSAFRLWAIGSDQVVAVGAWT